MAFSLPAAYLRITDIRIPDRVAAGRPFIITVSVEWSGLSSFIPVTKGFWIRLEICEGRLAGYPLSASDVRDCQSVTVAPSVNGEEVNPSGSKTYSIEIEAPKGAGPWNLVAIPELLACETWSHSTLFFIPRSGCWSVVNWGGEFWQEFKVRVVDKVVLTVKIEPGVAGAPISVDGTILNTDAGGIIHIEASTLDSHITIVPSEIAVGYHKKMVFVKWSDEYNVNSRTDVLTDDATFIAKYTTKYQLTVESELSDTSGTGWYDEGSQATFVVTAPPSDSPKGLFDCGHAYVFVQWTGDSRSTSPTASVTMDGPKNVKAQWRTDTQCPISGSTLLYVVMGSAATIVVALAVLLLVKRSRKPGAESGAPIAGP